MKREELQSVLKKTAPALAAKNLIPVFSCFCFTDKLVYAWDDLVALEFPVASGFQINGGVRGQVLLDFVNASKGVEAEVTQTEENVTVKIGRAKLELPVLPESEFAFEPPDVKGAEKITLSDQFVSGLAKAALSMGRDPSHPNRLGVTGIFKDGNALLLATDGQAGTKVRVGKRSLDYDDATPIVLPPRFVEMLLGMGKDDSPTTLYVTKEWAEVRFNSGLRLFSRTIAGHELDTFKTMFAGVPKKSHDTPKGLAAALGRALVVIPYAKQPYTSLEITGGKAKLVTKSPVGNVTDSIKFPGHADVSAWLAPKLVLAGLEYTDNIAVTPSVTYLNGNGFTYLASNVQNVEEGGKDD